MNQQNDLEQNQSAFVEQVIRIYRCSTVVKGGRRFSFAALVVVGDKNGRVGIGYGKAKEVPVAVEKGIKIARRNIHNINLLSSSIPHLVTGHFSATEVRLIPASEGTGVIAGKSARSVLELAGVHDVLTKVYGSTSARNVVKATMDALLNLYSKEQIEKLRGVKLQLQEQLSQ
ncbi:MAG: 30S ribosomal protein S5 [Planctomycetes bacterium]|nr:30S ribosomal protein S5 [Planctomycetota bacterium]